jgi:UDP-N-acetylglucosamine--N-acetylmuramyl-(pentapeptide) pyrophosphoryl-undecaprenol N-acetylglucosamine transferase
MKTIVIMAGGTGGHIFPGLAVADEMRAAGWEVVWMGARGGMEERLVPPRGYKAAWIRARAARGKGLLQKLLLPANLLLSFWESARHLRRIRPNVVLGLGGCGPGQPRPFDGERQGHGGLSGCIEAG